MTSWRVFVGFWDEPDELTVTDLYFQTWAEAHTWMVAKFEHWTHDGCEDCANNAAEQLPSLRALQPDSEWQGEIEGDDYVIEKAQNKSTKLD